MSIVKLEGLASEIREKKARAKWIRAKYVSQRVFLRRWVPGIAPRVEACGTQYRVMESTVKRGRYIAVPQRCDELPWCIPCVQYHEGKRVRKAIEAFERCTPQGQEPRFIHIVQNAPYGRSGQYVDGGDWGRQARQDVRAFKQVVWATLEEMYGTDLGGILSYQEFGEEGFSKPHPHIDLTLNGWNLQDGKPTKTPFF